MLNRIEQPELNQIDEIDFVAPEIYEISEGVKLYHMKEVPNETTRFDLYFDAGKCKQKNGIPAFVNGLLLSGTQSKTTNQINEEINGLGGFYEAGVAMENSVVSMYCLKENVLPIFNTLHDAIKNLAFIDKEVEQFLSDRKQNFKISLEKVGVLAQRKFQNALFNSNENYGYITTLSDIENARIEELKSFHSEHYLKGLNKVVVVGDIDSDVIEQIIELSKEFISKSTTDSSFEKELKNKVGQNHFPKEKAMQSAIRVGRILFNKKHEDYIDFLVLNTILGDYFGSRLMSNIREDKGYTYGIGSMLAEFTHTGYFLVATEVGVDVRDAAIKEIRLEFERLQNEIVPENELAIVRNYMLGQLLKSADGPYAMCDLYMSTQAQGLELDFYNKVIKRLNEINGDRIMALAKKHLNWDEMTIVTAG